MRRTKFKQGVFTPKNPEKYIGSKPIRYRSKWELGMMVYLDESKHVSKWASESIKIPYKNPWTRKATIYVPDFFVQYMDRKGNVHTEVIEVKPLNQSVMEKAGGIKNKIAVAINKAKWSAANQWAKNHGMTFRVVTETSKLVQATGKK